MAAAKCKPRYAPEDPTLPKPWRALIDGITGYLYFWNPETKVTQYEKPLPDRPPSPRSEPESRPKSDEEENEANGQREQQQHFDQHTNDIEEHSHFHYQPYQPSPTQQDIPDEFQHESYGMHEQEHDVQILEEPVQEHRPVDVGSHLSGEAYRRQHEITVSGDAPHPFTTFESTGFPSEILREVLRAGFSAPTPIQAQSWPIALQDRDIVAVAKTGSGKTLGYLIPGFIHLKRLQTDSKMGPRVLVLSPTRELATQIHDEAEKFGRSSRISSVCLYGGAPKGPQLRDLDRGADVVIATPGRLNDILEMGRVSLHQISYMVLDEADRMLDMGFEPQIRKIVNAIPPRRQTLMFTATWPKEVRKIAADLLVNPVQVNIGNIDELVANKSITQHVELITPMEKRRRVEQILRSQDPGSRTIIFCATKRMCDQLARTLTDQFGAAAIHGDKCQSERDSILSRFRNGASPVLVATDVAARGLDVKDIRVVINYDFPTGIEDYVHRIGRTGRAGATGTAYTFFSDQDSKYASDLVKILEGASQQVPEELRDMSSRGGYYSQPRRWSSGSDNYGGGFSRGGRGGSSYGGDGYSTSSYSGRGGRSHGPGGRGDFKPTNDRDNDAPVWNHEKLMAASAASALGGDRSGQGSTWSSDPCRSRSRSPVRGGW